MVKSAGICGDRKLQTQSCEFVVCDTKGYTLTHRQKVNIYYRLEPPVTEMGICLSYIRMG